MASFSSLSCHTFCSPDEHALDFQTPRIVEQRLRLIRILFSRVPEPHFWWRIHQKNIIYGMFQVRTTDFQAYPMWIDFLCVLFPLRARTSCGRSVVFVVFLSWLLNEVEPLLNARADVTHQWAGLSALHFLGLTSSANSLERLLGEGRAGETVRRGETGTEVASWKSMRLIGKLRSKVVKSRW